MLYWIIKPFVAIFFRVFYKIGYKGRENIPLNTPVVLAPNHVNAFIDPVALGLLTRRKVRFFARGDVFKGWLAKTVLGSMGISPMYRIQEGYAEIKKNDKTFEECRRRLTANQVILLFPEGICVQERRLRPLKKGLARIIFQTEETLDFKKDVLVIPVGLNYTAAYKFRSKLFIDIGKPISIKEYEASFKQDKVRTINDFTKMFEQKMAEHLVIIKNKDNDKLIEDIEEIYFHQWIKDRNDTHKSLERQYQATREIASMINVLDTEYPQIIESLKETTSTYIKELNKFNLRDHLLRPENISKMNFLSFIFESQLILWGSIIYFFGLIMNYPPYYFAKLFSTKKIKNIEFFASVYANVAMVFWGIYYAIQILTFALVFRNWMSLGIYALTIPVLGFYCLWFYPIRQKIFGRWRLLRMVRKDKTSVENLVKVRAEIILELENAKRTYIEFLKS